MCWQPCYFTTGCSNLIPSKQQVPHLNPVSPILPVSQTSSGNLSSLNLHADSSDKLDFFHSQLRLPRNFLLQYRTPPRGPPVISTAPNLRVHRTGRRRTHFTHEGSKRYYSFNDSPHKFKNSKQPANKPAPPHQGTWGTTVVVNEESKPPNPFFLPSEVGAPISEN